VESITIEKDRRQKLAIGGYLGQCGSVYGGVDAAAAEASVSFMPGPLARESPLIENTYSVLPRGGNPGWAELIIAAPPTPV
jgi:hypothetical protein